MRGRALLTHLLALSWQLQFQSTGGEASIGLAVGVPTIIYGTAWKKDDTQKLVEEALRQGFRAIDTANYPKHYNEVAVGAALREAFSSQMLQRDDLWIQTKFTPDACVGQPVEVHPYNISDPVSKRVRASLHGSLEHLGVTYVNSLLLHAPMPSRRETLEAWREMERAHDEGFVHEIGLSNFNDIDLRWLLDEARIKPAFVQNRCLHKDGWDKPVRELCKERGIHYQGFWLLTGNRVVLGSELVHKIAKRYNSTLEQVLFSFVTQGLELIALSGTKNLEHMMEDLAVAAGLFTLTPAEIIELHTLEAPKYTSNDPVNAMFRSELQEDAKIYWVHPDSKQLVDNGHLPMGGSRKLNTYHSHEFAVQLIKGRTVFRWKADREQGRTQNIKISYALDVEFKNVGQRPLRVYWLGPSGQEVFQGDLGVEAVLKISTFLDHNFVIRSATSSALVSEWVASPRTAGTQRVEFEAPPDMVSEL